MEIEIKNSPYASVRPGQIWNLEVGENLNVTILVLDFTKEGFLYRSVWYRTLVLDSYITNEIGKEITRRWDIHVSKWWTLISDIEEQKS